MYLRSLDRPIKITLQHAFRARFPYEVKWEPVLHNRLRLATMHFGPRRLQMRFGVT